MNPAPLFGVMALLSIAPSAFAAGDPAIAPKARIGSLRDLRRDVERWGDYYNPRLSKQDVEDLVAWLNKNFYKFDR